MSCNFICWIQAAHHAPEMFFPTGIIPPMHVCLPCMSLPGPAWPRRQMLRLILDLLQGPTLGELFQNVSVMKSEKPELQKSRWNPQYRGMKGCLVHRPSREEPERERGLASL